MNNEFFVTITLPKRFYRKKAENQVPIMLNALKEYSLNFWDTCEGKMELTRKSNIHFHGIITYRKDQQQENFVHLSFLNECKKFSMVDCQIIKDKDKVLQYINKDIKQTMFVTKLSEKRLSYNYKRITIADRINTKDLFNRILFDEK